MTTAPAERPVILAVGTSLTAGYGLDPDDSWPSLVQKRIDAAGLPHRMSNAGVSGRLEGLEKRGWLKRMPGRDDRRPQAEAQQRQLGPADQHQDRQPAPFWPHLGDDLDADDLRHRRQFRRADA